MTTRRDRVPVAILISGRGSNMMALIRAARDPAFPAVVAGVVSDQPNAEGLARAREAGLPTVAIDRAAYSSKRDFEGALEIAITRLRVDFVCLAGFMRVLSRDFATRWRGRALNIHPSLLPAFRGLDTHERALAAGVRIHGCTVHFLSPDVDAGPIIAQAAVPVRAADTAATLAARVLDAEHRLYPRALALVASGQARLHGDIVRVTGEGAPGAMFF